MKAGMNSAVRGMWRGRASSFGGCRIGALRPLYRLNRRCCIQRICEALSKPFPCPNDHPSLLFYRRLGLRRRFAFDTAHNYPLPNLYVSMLQRMGIESDKFASSTGSMRGLEFT